MYKNKIKQYRIEKHMTIKELAIESKISSGYLCHLEKGNRQNPSINVMKNISKALDKRISDIFFIED